MRRRIAMRWIFLFVTFVITAGFTAVVPTASAVEGCPSYLIIGARGSGEPMEGGWGMGFRAGAYAAGAAAKMPLNRTEFYSLPYRAAGLDELPPGLPYYQSVQDGVSKLTTKILNTLNGCPGTRIGLIGYSQGAHVVHNTLDQLQPQLARDSIQAVILASDPRNFGGNTSYAKTVNLEGHDYIRTGSGAFPNSGELPADMRVMTTDFCITGDVVCDNDGTDHDYRDIFNNPTHSIYDTCCNGIDYAGILGRQFADRLLRGLSLSGPPKLGGTFIQPDLVDSWSDAQLHAEIADLKRNGVTQVVLQWSANSRNKREQNRRTAVYPTSQPGFTRDTNTDVVSRVLSAAVGNGVDVWLGLQVNDDWWRMYASDQSWLDQEAAIAKATARELWDRYSNTRSFRGWYLSFETDNVHFSGTAEQDRMIGFYRSVINDLRSYGQGTPIAIAPFFNALSSGLPGWQNATNWGLAWERILRQVDVDVIALQDGIGAGHVHNPELPAWFGAMNKAIGDSGSHARLIADTETFVVGASGLQPMAVSQIKFSMDAVRPYVSGYWAFSYSHYLSPRSKFGTNGYQAAYEYLLQHGQASGASPSTPGGLTATTHDAQRIDLDWNAASDPVGVTGYHIYRNNEFVATTVGSGTSFQDNQLDPGMTYQYRIMAMNGSGLSSNPTATVSASTPSWPTYPVNYARCGAPDGTRGCQYTVDVPADPSYPDDGTSLTDGIRALPLYSGYWQGRNAVAPYTFTIDLGTVRDIKDITSSWLQVRQDYAFLPASVSYSVSETGAEGSYRSVGSILTPAVPNLTLTKTYRSIGFTERGRYVKVLVDGGTAWSLVDEVQVRGD